MDLLCIKNYEENLENRESSENKEKIIELRPSSKRWNPYVDNGGTVIGLANNDYAILVADTRLSIYYSIYTRYSTKLCKLTDKCAIGSSGMQSDIKMLHALLQKKIELFILEHSHYPDIHVIARLLCIVLYSRRFFPYYTFNLLAGVDNNNKGVLYGFDAIGSHEELPYSCVGSGSALIYPILDSRIKQDNQLIKNKNFNRVDDVNFIKDAISSAVERDIYTGDSAEIYTIDSTGIYPSTLDLKKD